MNLLDTQCKKSWHFLRLEIYIAVEAAVVADRQCLCGGVWGQSAATEIDAFGVHDRAEEMGEKACGIIATVENLRAIDTGVIR